ncbi:MAG: sodium/glutamate symporter [Gammaproteobacteria bacterium]|nr:MAG: sodium/glutamate symporter [Gammaproteobacteria bacterium]RLA51782.1 MAG: sodium/glutamate symporter [Gammaproteobacteria bacterium]
MEIVVDGSQVLVTSIVVWFLGASINRKVAFLDRYSIPVAVTGGLICSTLVALAYVFADWKISFDMAMRDTLLLIFFSTIGLTAKLRLLKEGGKALALLLLIATFFLVIQNVTGVLLIKSMGQHPAYGLFGGSVSFAGGYGTAIAWGGVAEEAGLKMAKEIGIAFATFGLIAGGIIGGPVGEFLIKRQKLKPLPDSDAAAPLEKISGDEATAVLAPPISSVLGTIMLLAICVGAGDLVNKMLFSHGVTLPGFLTSMMVGIILTNGADLLKVELSDTALERGGELSLQLFLCMSLMSIQLWTLTQAIGPILIVLGAQIVVMTAFATWIVYRFMGRDYDAAVIASGFTGLGLGATPVGIANMNALTSKYGPSPKAFLVIPLVGAFFIDLVNALVIKFFVALPIMAPAISQAPT